MLIKKKKNDRGYIMLIVLSALFIFTLLLVQFLRSSETNRTAAVAESAQKKLLITSLADAQRIQSSLRSLLQCWVYRSQCNQAGIPLPQFTNSNPSIDPTTDSVRTLMGPINFNDPNIRYVVECVSEGPNNASCSTDPAASYADALLPKLYRIKIAERDPTTKGIVRVTQELSIDTASLADYSAIVTGQNGPIVLGPSSYGQKMAIFHANSTSNNTVTLDITNGSINFGNTVFTDITENNWFVKQGTTNTMYSGYSPDSRSNYANSVGYNGGVVFNYPAPDMSIMTRQVQAALASANFTGATSADHADLTFLDNGQIQIQEYNDSAGNNPFGSAQVFNPTNPTGTGSGAVFRFPESLRILNPNNYPAQGSATYASDQDIRLLGSIIKSSDSSMVGLYSGGNIIVDQNAVTLGGQPLSGNLGMGQNVNNTSDTQVTFKIEASLLALSTSSGKGQAGLLDPGLMPITTASNCKGTIAYNGMVAAQSMPVYSTWTNGNCSGFLSKQANFDPHLLVAPPPGFSTAAQLIQVSVTNQEINSIDLDDAYSELALTPSTGSSY